MSPPSQVARYATQLGTGGPDQGGRALTDEESVANSRAIDELVKQLGGKEGLLDTLSIAAEAPECEQIVSWLMDPRYARYSIKQLCIMGGLTILDLFTAYKKAAIVRAHLVAYQTITSKLSAVVDDVMRRAAPYTIPCSDCGATGRVGGEKGGTHELCPACHGHKAVIVQPDLDRQKLALELAQLLQKSPGFTVQQNTVNVSPGTHGPGSLVELQRAVKDALHGPRRPLAILDAEPEP